MEPRSESSHKPTDTVHLTLEAWPQGLVVGALLPMILVTISNMRKGSLLHKLILLEVRSALLSPSLPSANLACSSWSRCPTDSTFSQMDPPLDGYVPQRRRS